MSFFIHGIKVLLIDSGLGRDQFLGEAQAQSVRRSAYTWSIVDRLDTFSITKHATVTPMRNKPLACCIYASRASKKCK